MIFDVNDPPNSMKTDAQQTLWNDTWLNKNGTDIGKKNLIRLPRRGVFIPCQTTKMERFAKRNS